VQATSKAIAKLGIAPRINCGIFRLLSHLLRENIVAYYIAYKRSAAHKIEKLGYVELEDLTFLERYKFTQALPSDLSVKVLWDNPSGPSIGITPLPY
jgi:hypothetical protein